MFDASTLEVFIASTNDLREERRAVEEVLRDWNSRNGRDRQIMLKPIRWEEDATPELGPGSFQAVINERLLDPADVLIGIIGKRLGSPTATSIAGTVEEIERFAAANKPVLLYFSDRDFNLSAIDPQDLQRVLDFRQAMQTRGLFLTFTDISDFKARLRGHLDTLLQDYQALLIPAGHALAFGFFNNFVAPTYTILNGLQVNLPDYKLPNEDSVLMLAFSSFRIRIAKPVTWEDATDTAVVELRKNRLAEISVQVPTLRRAYRIYVPIETKERLEATMGDNLERAAKAEPPIRTVQLDRLDVVDFPTPMIALHEFIKSQEQSILKGKRERNPAAGYWQRQKLIQYNAFFDYLNDRIQEEGMQGPSITYFDYKKSPDFQLPD
jgi:hypothetical protein